MPSQDARQDEARLRMAGVGKSFGATAALRGVDLEVRSGEVHALIGENGAGKSTLMKVLSGAYLPDTGSMWLDGQPYRPADPADGRRAGVAMIYQELALAPHLSVAENILLGAEPVRGPFLRRSEMTRRAAGALAEIGHPDIRPDVPVSRLSVAEQQVVEIARSVAVGCRVLVLDEPTSSLTGPDIRRLFDLIRRLRARGIAIVYISHFLEEVQEISDRYTVLRDGRAVGGGTTAGAAREAIIAMMVGREVADLYPRSERAAGEPLLEVEELSGQDKPRAAALSVRRGEVLGIAGLVGAGRTELVRAIFGLDPVRSGRIRVGLQAGLAEPRERWQQGLGMVSENRKEEGLALGLSVADNLTLPRLRGLGPWRFVVGSVQERVAGTWLEALAVRCRSAAQPVGDLSGGNQQKVALARLLHADVDVLLLDEPTRGIDVGSKAQIYRLIDQLARGEPARGQRAKAVLVVSSYLPELLGICDRIAVMCRGRLGPARPVQEWTEHSIMAEAIGADSGKEAA